MTKVGFIGLGVMGLPMAKNIINAGYDTYVYSRSRGPIDEALSYGAKEASSPKELIEIVDVLHTCLPFSDAIIEVYEGENGIISGVSKGKLVIGHETVSPEINKRVNEKLTSNGANFLEAPVSGGPLGAEAGTLTIICGGDSESYEKALNLLKTLGKNIVHVGPIGSGNTIKIINNMLVGIHIAGLAQAYEMGEKAGVNLQTLYDIIKKSSGFARIMDWWGVDVITNRRKVDIINLKMLHKDLELAISQAKRLQVLPDLIELSGQIAGYMEE